MEYRAHDYQRRASQFIIDHPACGLFLQMGLGKTVTTLTAIRELMMDRLEVGKVLVIAPLRVAMTVWAEEIQQWDHLHGLRAVKILGDKFERAKALNTDADIYIINRENVPWLCEYLDLADMVWPFDMVVIDQLSSFKSGTSKRFKALRKVRPQMRRVVGLTGTPAPNGLIDLWSQIYLLDRGERLGKTLGGYRERYFKEGRRNQQIVFEWLPKPEAEEAIHAKLADLCVSMTAQDYLNLPDRNDITVKVQLPPAVQKAYQRMEKDLVLPLDGEIITAATAAVVTGKLLQMANGALYDDEKTWHRVHDGKLEALQDLIEAANGQPVLIYYSYKHDLDRILQRFPSARVLKSSADVDAWNRGEVPVMLAHPDSAGHGLNLQKGGHILIWFGLTWSLEKYQQACARLHRQGQKMPVTIYHIVAEGTVDEDVMQVLAKKETRQNALIEAVKARVIK